MKIIFLLHIVEGRFNLTITELCLRVLCLCFLGTGNCLIRINVICTLNHYHLL